MRSLVLVLALLAGGCRGLLCSMRGGEVLYDEDWGRACSAAERRAGTCPVVELRWCYHGDELLDRWSLPLR